MRLLSPAYRAVGECAKGTDIFVQLERLAAYRMQNLVDFDKYTGLSMAVFLCE